jgi:hypothetical protein
MVKYRSSSVGGLVFMYVTLAAGAAAIFIGYFT